MKTNYRHSIILKRTIYLAILQTLIDNVAAVVLDCFRSCYPPFLQATAYNSIQLNTTQYHSTTIYNFINNFLLWSFSFLTELTAVKLKRPVYGSNSQYCIDRKHSNSCNNYSNLYTPIQFGLTALKKSKSIG